MVDCNLEAVVSILKEIKKVLPMTEFELYRDEDKSDSEFICDTLGYVVSEGVGQKFFKVDEEADAIRAKIRDHIGSSFSYVGYLESCEGRYYSFKEGQVARQELLDRLIAEFEAELV